MIEKKILVTGGGGFLGSHLCERLLNEGHEVICLDNFFTGNKQNILELMSNPRFELLRHDVTLPLYIEVDEIYNLACPASPVHYSHNPVKTIQTNVVGTYNMAELARQVIDYMDEGVQPQNSYRVLLDGDGELVWVTEVDGREVRYHREPETSFGQRFMSGFIMLLPVEHQL